MALLSSIVLPFIGRRSQEDLREELSGDELVAQRCREANDFRPSGMLGRAALSLYSGDQERPPAFTLRLIW